MIHTSRVAASALFGLSTACGVGACVDVLGIETLTRDPCGGFAHVDPACADCSWASCCVESAACAADAICQAAEGCLAACPPNDPVCRQACAVTRDDGGDRAELFAAVDDCGRASCLDACYGQSGWGAFGAGGCGECVEKCEPLARNCVANARCEAALGCAITASDPGAVAGCGADFPDLSSMGEALLLASCMLGCAEPCGLASDFGCVDRYAWYIDESQTVPVNLRLTKSESASAEPLVGARVRACPAFDCSSCLAQVGPGDPTTDADGVVPLEVPQRFEGCFAIQGTDRVPMLLYLGHPITMPIADSSWGAPSLEVIAAGAESIGVTLDPTLGALWAQQGDCRLSIGVVADFASSNAGADASPWAYTKLNSQAPAIGAEGDRGVVLNHAVGNTLVTGYQDGVAVSSYSVYVGSGAFTVVALFPRWIQ